MYLDLVFSLAHYPIRYGRAMGIDIKRLGRLAMLRLSGDEERSLSKDIERIIEFFRQLDGIELEDIDPLFHVTEKEARVGEDLVEEGIKRIWIERSAARTMDGYVAGPRTILGEGS